MTKKPTRKKMPSDKSTKAPKTRKTANFWYHRHNRIGLLLVVFVFAIAGYFLLFSKAAPNPPNVYLTPTTQVLPINTTFTVQVRETSGTTAVNAVQANFSYPTSLVSFVSISSTGSAFPTVAQATGASGQVNIGAGVSTAGGTAVPVTGDQLVATVTFKTLTTGGAATMAFTSGTVLVNSSSNTDILGGLGATTGGTYTIDTTPPTVSVTAPTNGSTIGGGGTVTITATATDTQSNISTVDFYVDGTKIGSDTVTPYTFAWNTASLALGTHTIQVKAVDSSGNTGQSTTITVTLADQTAPTAPTALHATGSTYTTIGLAWTASTDNVGVTGYRIQRNGITITTTSGTTVAYTDTGLTAGTSYNYSVVALDAAGNASAAATLTTTALAQVPGDADGDGHVGSSDLTTLLANWQSTTNTSCDFNGDHIVNILDLSVILSHYGT